VQVEARQESAVPILDHGIRRQSDGGDAPDALRRRRTDLLDERVAVLLGHADVGDEDVRDGAFELRERRVGAGGDLNDHAARLEQHLEELACIRLVVDDEHGDALEAHGQGQRAVGLDGRRSLDAHRRRDDRLMGRRTVNFAPWPRPPLEPSSVPPCSVTRCLAMASPTPSPPCARVVVESDCRKLSNM